MYANSISGTLTAQWLQYLRGVIRGGEDMEYSMIVCKDKGYDMNKRETSFVNVKVFNQYLHLAMQVEKYSLSTCEATLYIWMGNWHCE